MTNPYSAGGGGTHFEARIVAYCLAATICEAGFRGLRAEYVSRVDTQRADFGDFLDDVILHGPRSDGGEATLHLQAKKALSFTKSDEPWKDVINAAWLTITREDFDVIKDRVGVVVGTYSSQADKHYQSVLTWATESVDGANFIERIEKKDYSHQAKRDFVETIREILIERLSKQVTDDDLWRLLRSFVILHFDFQNGASRDEALAVGLLSRLSDPPSQAEAKRAWDYLIVKAGQLVPAGGGATRDSLAASFAAHSIKVGPSVRFVQDIAALDRESRRAVADIRDSIRGLRLHRADAYDAVKAALTEGRFVQINGEPGCGKSALLKRFVEESANLGPVFVLKDARIHPRGWSSYAATVGVSDDIVSLLREFARSSEPILFIDGIDKISDPASQLTVNDVLRAIVGTPDLVPWRVLVTIREQNLKHLETWLDPAVLKALPIKTINVGPLNNEELSFVAESFPRLQPLVSGGQGMDVILRRPFFLETILFLGNDGGSAVPATEVELLNLWWRLGAGDQPAFAQAQRRRNALLQLAERIANAPGAAISVKDIDETALAELIEANVLRQHTYGHSVEFSHDIYEEWSLTQLLVAQEAVIAFLQKCDETDSLIRPMQLLAAFHLETAATVDRWEALYSATGAANLRSVWQRTVLTAPLHSVRATELLGRISEFLKADDGIRLRRLITAVRTSEVVPNPLFLDETATPNIDASDRAKFALLAAQPKTRTWIRFLNWFVPITASLGPLFIPDMVKLFQPWQSRYSGQNVRHCRAIGLLSYEWLTEIEEARHPAEFRNYRKPFGVDLDTDDLEKEVRKLFLASVGDVKSEAATYLKLTSGKRNRHQFRSAILENCVEYGRHLPIELVDFILASFLRHPRDREQRHAFDVVSDYEIREFGLEDNHSFYPASPARLPFLMLLRWHKAEGLRLIRSFCNFAMDVWRWSVSRESRDSESLTPIPVSIEFEWGKQEFWGTNQTYLWFRGVWGNNACESGLMALEQWALEELDRGVPFAPILQDVIEGNESVAALGIGVSLALASPEERAVEALPLLTCPALWLWDIQRYVHDIGKPSNEIASWLQHRTVMQAVRDLNQKPHRKQDIRSLVGYVLISGEQKALDTYTKEIRSFPDRLPISFKEELENSEHVAALTEQMKNFAEQGDPQYFKAAETLDGQIAIYNDPPMRQKEEFKELAANHAKLNELMGLALWANEALEKGTLGDRFTIAEAMTKAKSIDFPEIFDDRSQDNLNERQAMSAVSGVAFVAAAFLSTEELSDALDWILDILQRAATGPEADGSFAVRSSHLLMHPAVFAAHGFSQLLSRDVATEVCIEGILNLAVDAMTEIQSAVFTGSKVYASKRPEIIWALIVIGLKQSIHEQGGGPDPHSVDWDVGEATRNLALIDEAEASIRQVKYASLPIPPLPWIKGSVAQRRTAIDTKGYVRNPIWFYHHDAEKTVLLLSIEALAGAPTRSQFLILVGQMVNAMVQEMHPPFSDARNRDRSGHTPFEWIYAFSYWCGRFASLLTIAEVKTAITDRVLNSNSETALQIMQTFLRGYMVFGLLPADAEISKEKLKFWTEVTDWMFSLPEWTYQRADYLDREFQSAAFSLLFCAQNDFSPIICGLETDWPHFKEFTPLFERTVREFGRNNNLWFVVIKFFMRGGFALLPNPGLRWLHDIVQLHKDDLDFWESNGEDTVELLKRVFSEKATQLSAGDRVVLTSILDTLVDGGVRGAGFVQQELSRSA